MGAIRLAGSIVHSKVDGMTVGPQTSFCLNDLISIISIPKYFLFYVPHQDIVWHFKSISFIYFFICASLLRWLSLNRSSDSHYFLQLWASLQRVVHQTRRPPTAPLTTDRWPRPVAACCMFPRHSNNSLDCNCGHSGLRAYMHWATFCLCTCVHAMHMCARSNHIAPRRPDDLFACLRSASGAGAQAIWLWPP